MTDYDYHYQAQHYILTLILGWFTDDLPDLDVVKPRNIIQWRGRLNAGQTAITIIYKQGPTFHPQIGTDLYWIKPTGELNYVQ